MLVEDTVWFRQALALLFDNEDGLRVIAQAGSLAEAREKAAALQDTVDLAILDFYLPDGRGTELIAELRRAWPNLQVLVFTVSVDPAIEDHAREAGATSTLHKAASKAEILERIRLLTQKK